jgi:hypothetical protein
LPQQDETTQMAQRLVGFLELTEAKVTHLEFAPWCGPHVVPKDATVPPEVDVPVDESGIKAQRGEIEFALGQFHSCQTLEVWGNDMTSDVINILETRAPSLLASPQMDHISQPEDLPSTSIFSPLVHLDGLTGSLNVIDRSNSSSPEESDKRPKRQSILGARQIIAKVIAAATSSKRRSLAIVGTPEHTPRIMVNELPLESNSCSPGKSIDGSYSPSRPPDVSKSHLIGTAEPSSSQMDSPSGSGPKIVVTPPSIDPVGVQKETFLPHLNKFIVHDASYFNRTIMAQGLQVETFG